MIQLWSFNRDGVLRRRREGPETSGLALVLSRDGSPVASAELEAVSAALGHRGIDGTRSIGRSGVLLAHQHFWTTPEEVGERQPIEDPDGDCDLLFDGRLDNRDELAAALSISELGLSDARLVLAAWQAWGTACFARLLGPFAIVIRDGVRRRVVAARDPLGDRTLFYWLNGKRAIAASEECAVLRHPQVSSTLDEESLARYFAIDAPRPGATFFAGVRELLPGHRLMLDATGSRLSSFWALPLHRRLRLDSEAEYVRRFDELLRLSVRCRLRADPPPAVLMSGGLDSTSVAALAHTQLPPGAGPLHTISWVFRSLPEADESRFIDAMVKRYGFEASLLPGDDAWPLRDLGPWRDATNRPKESPFRLLAEEGYRQARSSGTRVLLTGEYGDHLFAGGAYWLRDTLEEDPSGAAGLEGLRRMALNGVGPSLRSVLARAIGIPARKNRPLPWLTGHARALLEEHRATEADTHPRPEQARLVLGARAARGASGETPSATRAGIEIRQPFRDRRLVEFMLAVPAYLLFRPPWTKWLLREAMDGILPQTVRSRRHRSSLRALFAKGLTAREQPTVQRILWERPRIWPRFVSARWMRKWSQTASRGEEGAAGLVPWYCVAAELWGPET